MAYLMVGLQYMCTHLIYALREVSEAGSFMNDYINHPETICIHSVNFRLDTTCLLGGVRKQRICSEPSFLGPLGLSTQS